MDRHRPQARGPRTLPLNIYELVKELGRQYPEPRPTPGQASDDIMYAAGQRSVVLALLDRLTASEKADQT